MSKLNQERVDSVSAEILASKNWTGLTLAELASAGRVIPETAKNWTREFFIQSEKSTLSFFFERVLSAVEKKVAELNR